MPIDSTRRFDRPPRMYRGSDEAIQSQQARQRRVDPPCATSRGEVLRVHIGLSPRRR